MSALDGGGPGCAHQFHRALYLAGDIWWVGVIVMTAHAGMRHTLSSSTTPVLSRAEDAKGRRGMARTVVYGQQRC